MRGKWHIFLLAGCLAAAGCVFQRLKLESEALEDQWVLISKVKFRGEKIGSLVAVVYEVNGSVKQVYAFREIPWRQKKFAFLLDPGDHDYRVAVFHDRNRNLIIDEEEPVAMANDGNRVRFSNVTTWINTRVSMSEARALPSDFPRDLAALQDKEIDKYHIAVGDIADPDDDKFSAETGMQGLWEPHRFLKKYGMGVYMLEPYDPSKIPVLFVSGAGGNIHNWDYFFKRLDKSRYQAWYYYYPSGVRIFRLGQVLHLIVSELKEMYGFDGVIVIAHSMGGLVSREFIKNQMIANGRTDVTKFVSISTPWNGHSLAKSGVENLSTPLSKPIPSWHDVVPGSRFLQGVFSKSIGGALRYYLIFSFLDGTDGDGSVELSSQLLPEAQDEAIETRGFKVGHVEVLFRDDVFEYVESCLEAEKEKPVAHLRGAQEASEESDAGTDVEDL